MLFGHVENHQVCYVHVVYVYSKPKPSEPQWILFPRVNWHPSFGCEICSKWNIGPFIVDRTAFSIQFTHDIADDVLSRFAYSRVQCFHMLCCCCCCCYRCCYFKWFSFINSITISDWIREWNIARVQLDNSNNNNAKTANLCGKNHSSVHIIQVKMYLYWTDKDAHDQNRSNTHTICDTNTQKKTILHIFEKKINHTQKKMFFFDSALTFFSVICHNNPMIYVNRTGYWMNCTIHNTNWWLRVLCHSWRSIIQIEMQKGRENKP